MKNVNAPEMLAVIGVGFLLAQATKRVPVLNENTMFTRTALYALGYYIATRRPEGGWTEGGYKLLGGGS